MNWNSVRQNDRARDSSENDIDLQLRAQREKHIAPIRMMLCGRHLIWDRPLLVEAATYPRGAPLEGAEELLSDIRSRSDTAAQHSRTLFLAHLSLTVFTLLTLMNISDKDFFEVAPSLRLPFIDVSARPRFVVFALPVICVASNSYLQIYLGQLRRLRRRIALIVSDLPARFSSRVSASDPDTNFPWLATMSHTIGPFGKLVRTVEGLLIWMATPLLCVIVWIRLLPMNATLSTWFRIGPPPAWLLGVVAMLAILMNMLWLVARHRIDAELGLHGPRVVQQGHALLYGVVAVFALAPVSAINMILLPQGLRSWVTASGVWRIDLRNAHLSLPPQKDDVRKEAIGALLGDYDLRNADLRGAYLVNADLKGARLLGADLSGAIMNGANLDRVEGMGEVEVAILGPGIARHRLESSDLGGPFQRSNENDALQENSAKHVTFENAAMRGVSLRNVRLNGAVFSHADLSGAVIDAAQMQGADFSDAILNQAFVGNYTDMSHSAMDHLKAVGLVARYSTIDSASIRNAHFEGADFKAVSLKNSDLAWSHLEASTILDGSIDKAGVMGAFVAGMSVTTNGVPRKDSLLFDEPPGRNDFFGEACFSTVSSIPSSHQAVAYCGPTQAAILLEAACHQAWIGDLLSHPPPQTLVASRALHRFMEDHPNGPACADIKSTDSPSGPGKRAGR